MYRRIIILLACWPSLIWGAGVDRGESTLIRTFQVLQAPLASMEPEALLQEGRSRTWETVHGSKNYRLRPKTDHFLRFQLPSVAAEPLVIEYYFSQTEPGDGLQAEAYALVGGQLRRLDAVDSQFAAWLLPEPQSASTIIIRSRNHTAWYIGANLIVKLSSLSAHGSQLRRNDRLFGLIAGVVGIMIIFNVSMQLVFRRNFYISYILYTVAALYWHVFFFGYLGYGQLYIGLFFASMGAVLVAIMHFICQILNVRREYPRIYRIMRYEMAFFALLSGGLFTGIEIFTDLFIVLYALPMLSCMTVAVLSARRGYLPAYPIVIGWVGLCVAALVSILDAVLIHSMDTSWVLPSAGAFEIATFSFAVGQKFRLTELAFIRQNKHAFNQMKKIIYPHQLQQIREGQELELTMPTDAGESCVICFDIVGSSRINPMRANPFFRSVFRQCYELMMHGYSAEGKPQAKAYRIKELGDGFLCSVGHPFASLSTNPAAEAVELAQQFAQILQKQSRMLGPDAAVHCSIGIASGPIRGYYPETGVKEYELSGSAIVLATRYEAMRRVLALDTKQSVIIIQESVYERLPASMQQDFRRIELRPDTLSVRDDPEAKALYVQAMAASLSQAS